MPNSKPQPDDLGGQVTKGDPLADWPRIGTRRWIAWKLVQLAHRIFDADFIEQIVINDRDGVQLVEFVIVGDAYGCGISLMHGPDTFDGYSVQWLDCPPQWLIDGDC